MRNRFPFALAALLCLSFFGWCGGPVAAMQEGLEPAAGDEPPVETTEDSQTPPSPQIIEERHLANGVRVITQPIDGVNYAAIVVVFEVGSSNDPSDAPGMARLFDRLLMTCPSQGIERRSVKDLNETYPKGWNIRSYDAMSVYGVVVPTENLSEEVEGLAKRLRTLEIGPDDIARETGSIEAEMKVLFDDQPLIKPMSWLVAKSFRHDSGAARGVDPVRLARLRPDRIIQEWQQRTVGGNVTVILVGNVGGIGLDATTDRAFGSLASGDRPPFPVTVHPVGEVVRDILDSSGLPGNRLHGVAAFFAPPVTSPDHPAFLTVCRALMRDAAGLAGSQGRMEFQYDMLLDPRAAYVTPHAWRYPKGPLQALGYWDAKIKNRRYTHADALRTLGALDWQLGAPLRGGVVDQLAREPGLLYTIGFATAYRANYGDTAFWDGYRQKLERMDPKDLVEARNKYFADSNRALFVLKGD